MTKYNFKLNLFMLFFSILLFSCSDVVENQEEFNDFVKADSLDISKDSIFTTVFNIKGVKGQFRKEATTSIKYVGGDLYEGLIGDFSEGVINVVDSSITLTALAKKDETPKLIKSSIRGSALNEYGENIAFDDMVLEAYKIVTDEDTVDVKMNIVDNLIVAKMDGIETIESYEDAKRIVLADLNLDSTFALNSTFDDADVSDKDAGAMIAIGGLMMRSSADFSPSDWDVMPYENAVDEAQSFKYWATELGSTVEKIKVFNQILISSPDLGLSIDEYKDEIFKTDYKSICENAQKSVNSLETNGFRNLARFNISDEVKNECIDYISDFYYSRISSY